ncbi:hypothetical protein pSALSNUABM04_240 [Salmonella phage pSal-SNUABM-04]|nr:hypothetical protein pSALSNUABM04_240 [Salmonella phage pSal-SNUABM-04]
MFDVDIVPQGDEFAVQINGVTICVCDEQRANFWRCCTGADKVFVSCDVGVSFGEEPLRLCKFRITETEMRTFLGQVVYTYDHLDHENRVGWVEIDPTIMRTLRQGAEEIVESQSMWLDEDDVYPKGEPFILIHPERNSRTGEAFIELMFIEMPENDDVEEKESADF